MDRDALIAGLERELSRTAGDARKEAIMKEIEFARSLPVVEATAEKPTVAVDQRVGYLRGLYRELERVAGDRRADIKAEIARIESELKIGSAPVERTVAQPGVVRRGRPPKVRTDDE